MQPLYTEKEFKEAKSRQPLRIQCLNCQCVFTKTKHHIQIAHHRRGTNDFCSRKCRNQHYRIGHKVRLACDFCGKSFHKDISRIRTSLHHFCCQSCAAKYTNTHKTKGTRVSKLERWLQDQLPKFYPTLDFHFNRKDAINGELDIYIPSLKLAFELNGIFHYEPIYGKDKLASIQNNDNRKSQACLERGVELCIIDISSLKYFKEQKAMKFLNIVKDIINLRLGS